jgi:hypothetical protein
MNQWFMGPRPNTKYKIWLAYLIQISEERHNNSLSFIFIAQLFSRDSVSILGLILRERIDCSHHRWQIPSRLLIILSIFSYFSQQPSEQTKCCSIPSELISWNIKTPNQVEQFPLMKSSRHFPSTSYWTLFCMVL